ncbi:MULTISPECIES: hypothetical protein [Actinoalloteichus]|nr:hypothetical protein [Actinoalloteichus caeruleus]
MSGMVKYDGRFHADVTCWDAWGAEELFTVEADAVQVRLTSPAGSRVGLTPNAARELADAIRFSIATTIRQRRAAAFPRPRPEGAPAPDTPPG